MNNDKKRILLVDDEHDITFAFRIGFHCHCCCSDSHYLIVSSIRIVSYDIA